MGNHIAVFGDRQQLVAAVFARLFGGHFARQLGETHNVQAHGFQYDINGFQELLTVQVFQYGQVNAGTTLGDFGAHAIEAFF